MFLGKLFKKKNGRDYNPFRLKYKEEWDLVVVSGEKRLYKKEFFDRMLENADVEWVHEPVSETFSWRHARLNLHGKVLNIWDADTITEENRDDWPAIAKKIENADVWVQLEYQNEPFPRYLVDELVDKLIDIDDCKYGIRELRGVLYRIDGEPECNRYAAAFAALKDPNTSDEERAFLTNTINSDWSVGVVAMTSYKKVCFDDKQLKSSIFRMLLSSESNIKVNPSSD